MLAYIIRRIIWSIPVIVLLTFAVFALIRAVPAGPFDFVGDRSLPASVRENLERRNHLDWPMMWQFSSYLLGDDVSGAVCRTVGVIPGCDAVLESYQLGVSRGLIRGDLGPSLKLRGRSVNDIVAASFPVSLQLGLMALLLALVIGIPAGIIAALKQNTWMDYLASFVAVLGLSVPSMVIGPLLIWVFAVELGWLPVAQWVRRPRTSSASSPRSTVNFLATRSCPWSRSVPVCQPVSRA